MEHSALRYVISRQFSDAIKYLPPGLTPWTVNPFDAQNRGEAADLLIKLDWYETCEILAVEITINTNP